MKLVQLVFLSVVLMVGLSGCASTSYQPNYVEYSSRYIEQNYDDYLAPIYYQPMPVTSDGNNGVQRVKLL